MRLDHLVPPLPGPLVKALDNVAIKTDADFLFSASCVDILKRLPPNTATLSELIRYTVQIAESASAPSLRADECLAQANRADESTSDLSSGVFELDGLLDGFGKSCVIEVSGTKGSGKTALALHLVLRQLASGPNSGALWIDTTGDFSADRIVEALELYDGQAATTVLERLQVSSVFDIDAAYQVLEALRLSLSGEMPADTAVRCVVIDSVSLLLGPFLSAVSSEGHAIMTTFMRQLRVLAQTFSLTILVINTTSSSAPHNPNSAFASTTRKPALGPSFTFLTDATLWLAKVDPHREDVSDKLEEDSTSHIAEVFRSRTTRSKTWCTFKLRRGVFVHS